MNYRSHKPTSRTKQQREVDWARVTGYQGTGGQESPAEGQETATVRDRERISYLQKQYTLTIRYMELSTWLPRYIL